MKNKLIPLFCGLLSALLLAGCGKGKAPADSARKYTSDTPTGGIGQLTETEPPPLFPEYYHVDAPEAKEITDTCREIALLCGELIANGETETTADYPYERVLTQLTIDKVESLLAEKGYSVINSDEIYPDFLENSEGLARFFDSVDRGEDIQQSVIYVSQYNSIIYTAFQYSDSSPYYINATIAWDENGNFSISEPYKMDVLDWGVTDSKFFYYQVYPHNRHWTACVPIRLNSVDKGLYDLYREYIAPVGYCGSNIFLLDWNSSDYGCLCFNDLFEYLYSRKWNEPVDKNDYEFLSDMQYRLIPADIFEDAIFPYFEITLDEFRSAALYLEDKDAYPWQEINASNIVYYPEITPEITSCRKNPDGSFTLSIDVFCFDKGPSTIFTHETTIRMTPAGDFQYVSNAVTYRGEHSMPDDTPRLEAQRR